MKHILYILLFLSTLSFAQQPAFPEAYGAAAYTNPSRQGTVIHVTSLNDSDRNEVGTLRWAIQNDAHKALDRIIVFDVSGVIELNSWIYASNAPGDEGGYTGNIYIAGQTAPEGGITITGDGIVLSDIETVVVRYLKFRHSGGYDGVLRVRAENEIIDHCSISHVSNASAVSMASTESGNLSKGTFSNNLFGECDYAFIMGESNPEPDRAEEDGSFTVIRNAYYNVGWRVPFKGGSAIKVDAINNLVHNWQNRLIRMDGHPYRLNHFENYYQAGVNTSNQLLWSSYLDNATPPSIFTENNFLEDEPRGTYVKPVGFDTDESIAWTEFQNNYVQLPSNYFTSTQHTIIGREFEIYQNSQLKTNLLPQVGACKYLDNNGNPQFYRDVYDTEYVNGIDTDATQSRNDNLVEPIISLSNTRPIDFYGINPHIPSSWLSANGYSNTVNIHNEIQPSGYTLLEEYINQVDNQVKAFPTAYGGGAYASGGRGGNVYHVTSLADDGSVGTFRWALNQPRPATIVFDVSGTIELTTVLTVDGNDLTIAGQSAPEGGIDIVHPATGNHEFRLGTFGSSFENQIWRYIRIRTQYDPNNNNNLSLMPGYGEADYGRNVIFDHLSINYGSDEAFNIRGTETHNITFQHGLISETDRGSLFGDTNRTDPGLTDQRSKYNTFRNNVFYQSSHRVPNVGSSPADVYNNVVYDWKERLSVVVWGAKVNHFNNYYYKGTRTNLGYSWNGDPVNFRWQVNGITTLASLPVEIYSKGNIIQDLYEYDDTNPDISNPFQDDRYIWMHHAGELVDGTDIIPDRQQRNKADDSYFRDNPLPYVGAIPDTFLTAEEAKTVVPNNAGNYKYIKDDGTVGIYRDATDQRIVDAIINDTPTSWDISPHTASTSQAFLDYQATISSTPKNTRPVNFYDSNPHIPEVYLQRKGIVGNATIHNQVQPSGYTLLEEYLNQVDDENLKAFPTAVGAGAYVTGGRGGQVIRVTNLNDSGVGSFREAITTTGARTIVFDVSGRINLQSRINLNDTHSNLTIAGQTAPEGGITISGKPIRFGTDPNPTDNVIIRYIRFRNGSYTGAPDVYDHNGLIVQSMNGLIIDHCSFSFNDDQAISMSGRYADLRNITIQKNIFSNNATGIVAGLSREENEGDMTFIYNLFSSQGWRTPNVGGNLQYDIINNVVYNYIVRTTTVNGDTASGLDLNYIGNYIEEGSYGGAASTQPPTRWQDNGNSPTIYSAYNYHDRHQTTPILNDQSIWSDFTSTDASPLSVPNQYFTTTQHPLLGAPYDILSAQDAKDYVLEDVGANKSLNADGSVTEYIDSFDTARINDVINGTDINPQNKDYIQPVLPNNTRPANYDTDNDGMADIWESATFGNLSRDGTNDFDNDGYTDLEEFLNQVDNTNTSSPTTDVTGVEVIPTSVNLRIGQIATINRNILPSNASNQSGVWASSNNSVAVINQNGEITAVALGTTTISYTTDEGAFTDTCVVTVTESTGDLLRKNRTKIIINN